MKAEVGTPSDEIRILLVGNNPIDLSAMLYKINHAHGTSKMITETAFDLKTVNERLHSFTPQLIFIDDNIGKSQLAETVESLAANSKTKDVPITVLKNSNYEESYARGTLIDFILKANVTAESIYSILRNSLRFQQTKNLLRKAYEKKKRFMRKLQPKPKFGLQA